MSLTYVIADIHGRYDLLVPLLKEIAVHARQAAKVYKLIFLGDYIDRGPYSRQVIEALMKMNRAKGIEVICLKGNHEDMLVQFSRGVLSPALFMINGGAHTMLSYEDDKSQGQDASVPVAHIDWIADLPLYHEDDHRVYVHAYVDRLTPLKAQSNRGLMWELYTSTDEGGYLSGDVTKHVVHGHEQFADGPVYKKHRTDLDCFAWKTGRLVAGVFDDDLPGGPIGLVEYQGASIETLMVAMRTYKSEEEDLLI